MIDEMHVQNLALIESARLEPSPRLTVLTGETGAGKTALVNAVKLLIGSRADSSVVREGADAAEVSGRFFSACNAHEDALQTTTATDEDELVVMRRVSADGRSRASINGSMASIGELAQKLNPLVELCGQHEYQALLKPAEHARLLDAWADLEEGPAHIYRQALHRAEEAAKALEDLRAQATASQSQLDEARFVLKQIDAVDPQPGEYDELRDWLARAEHAEMLARNSFGTAEALSGENGALDALNSAIALLDEASRADENLAPYAQSLRETCFVVEDVARDMAGYCNDIEFDSATLSQAQERMGALSGLLRSFGPTFEEVAAARERAAGLVALADNADDCLAKAQQAVDEAEAALAEAASTLAEARRIAAPRFAAEVCAIMANLEMGTAELTCTVDDLERNQWTQNGPVAVTFQFKPGKSMQARPLARIASGGEISRVMLAVKVVLGTKDGTETLIFDEVDAGVGGNTANALADVLATLAETHQVIVITHLAQVAAVADAHYAVEKTAGDTPRTTLRPLTDDERVHEVARLLSGTATEASLAHAREMLEARS